MVYEKLNPLYPQCTVQVQTERLKYLSWLEKS